MKPKPITLIAIFALLGGGFFAGRISSSGSSTPSLSDPVTESRLARISERLSEEKTTGEPHLKRGTSRERFSSPEERNARLATIATSESLLDRQRAMLDYIDQLGPGDFEGAIEHFRSLGLEDSRDGDYALLLSAWSKMDPLAALAYAKEKTTGNFASSTILSTWATADPDAALSWAQSNFTGQGPNPYLIGVIRGMAESDPSRATSLLVGMPRSRERGDALFGMLPHVMKDGPDAARSWVNKIEDENLRNGAMMAATEPMAQMDPKGTIDWLLANPGQAADRRMDDTFATYAKKDLSAATAAYKTLPQGASRTAALSGLVDAVSTADPKAGLSLLTQNGADVTDRVWQGFIRNSFGTDPSLAVNQIGNIADEGRRDETYRRTLDDWLNRDPAAAQTWISRNSLPQPVQAHLARRQEQR